MLILTFPLHLLLPTLISALTMHFANSREFYHDLGTSAMQFLFNALPLREDTLFLLGQLVADNQFDIQAAYIEGCKAMSERRAEEMLSLLKKHRDLEMHLLGTTCLSEGIIEARKRQNMWPPKGFPLLVDRFRTESIPTTYIKDILQEALTIPQWWYSSEWQAHTRWDDSAMNLHFWRMIPILFAPNQNNSYQSYLMRALSPTADPLTHRSLEELLMKSIRLADPIFGYSERVAILRKISKFKDPWSIGALGVLERIYKNPKESYYLPRLILESGLLQLALWQGLVENNEVDKATVTNDILELFALAFHYSSMEDEAQEIVHLFFSLLRSPIDWSDVRPMVFIVVLKVFQEELSHNNPIQEHLERIIRDTNVLSVLSHKVLLRSTSLPAHKHRITKTVQPLRNELIWRAGQYTTHPHYYTELLYQQWIRDRSNWPGMIIVNEHLRPIVRGVFKPSKFEHGTYDPRVDVEFLQPIWELAFVSICFELQHDIPSDAVPSKCFLQALLYYHKNGLDWDGIERAADKKCSLPTSNIARSRYSGALHAARSSLFFHPQRPLPSSNLALLQALLRGDSSYIAGGRPNRVANRIRLRLQLAESQSLLLPVGILLLTSLAIILYQLEY